MTVISRTWRSLADWDLKARPRRDRGKFGQAPPIVQLRRPTKSANGGCHRNPLARSRKSNYDFKIAWCSSQNDLSTHIYLVWQSGNRGPARGCVYDKSRAARSHPQRRMVLNGNYAGGGFLDDQSTNPTFQTSRQSHRAIPPHSNCGRHPAQSSHPPLHLRSAAPVKVLPSSVAF